MKIIIAGSRTISNMDFMLQSLNSLIDSGDLPSEKQWEVVCGEARGADMFGSIIAHQNGIPVTNFPAQWKTYGKSAGYRRNVAMGEYADAAVLFWDGTSKGTKHMIDIMKSLKKPYFIFGTGSTEHETNHS
jgi:hypothetical protein